MRTAKICITEQSAILAKHRLELNSRNSHSKTRHDPAELEKSVSYTPPPTLVGIVQRKKKVINAKYRKGWFGVECCVSAYFGQAGWHALNPKEILGRVDVVT